MNRARAIRAAAALLALAACGPARAAATPPGCAPPMLTGGEWRSYGGDLANTRNQVHEKIISSAEVPTLTSAWVFSSVDNGGAGDFTGTPIVADGCMYIASTRGWVFAVNADTGKLVWKTQVPYGGGVNSSAAVGERTLPAQKVKAVKKRHKHRRRRSHRHRTRHRRSAR